MANADLSFALQPGERVVFRAESGGQAGYSGWLWLLVIFGGMQVFGAMMMIGLGASGGVINTIKAGTTIVLAGGLVVLWMQHLKRPPCVLTDRRLIVRRFLRAPLEVPVGDVGAAARFTIVYTRYGRTVGQKITDRVVVGLRSGQAPKIGPVKHSSEVESLLRAIASHAVDPRALPGAAGERPRAEERTDLFFALECSIAGARRGPVFAGPTKLIGFYHQVSTLRGYQLLTIVGADQSALEIEAGMVALAANKEWGQMVVMEREGRTLSVVGNELTLSSGDHNVGFTLAAADAERARAFTAPRQPYR